MKRKLIVASHGKFASGILSSLEIICGKPENITALDCYLTDDFDLSQVVAELMAQEKENELIVITDLFGGSVNNEFLKYIQQANFHLIAGLNLALLVEFITQLESYPDLPELIEKTLNSAKNMMQYCNETIQQEILEEDF